MNVVEKDSAVLGILEEEYRRCGDVVAALHKKMKQYPKGSLNIRSKKNNGKEYLYHYLILREKSKVINRHVPAENLSKIQNDIEQRDKCKKEIQVYKKRMSYLEKLLKIPKSRGAGSENPA